MTRILAACFLSFFVASVSTLHAHDPGLSFVEIRAEQAGIQLRAVFAEADIALITPIDLNGDGHISRSELETGRSGLEQIARESFGVYSDAGSWAAGAADVEVEEAEGHGEVLLKVFFTRPAGFEPRADSGLYVRSTILDRLPRGHRQLLSFFDLEGGSHAEILSSFNPDFKAQPSQRESKGKEAGLPVRLLLCGLVIAGGYWLLQRVMVATRRSRTTVRS